MNYCPNCGRMTIEGANFCPFCGENLSEYAGQLEDMQAGKQVPKQAPEQAHLLLFLEKNENYYLKNWQKRNSWNWAAFFVAPFWLGYRKMYRNLLLVFGVLIVADAILMMVFGHLPGIPDILAGLATAIFFGWRGNTLYKHHAERQISCILNKTYDERARTEEICEVGGTSDSGIFYGLLVLLGYLIFFAYT
ncbi:DUF2628 domain-containing protein [Aciduricibacillus chroicocephali]|uniref:DUF2628 domain-containing protein n=1 Tax=Aciduricibacillus chroicocephali TaxID=3054939 RepID=A0ABY9KU89_9BACI|nr:DUF2628 domain-containing protein [Bacillaceae bacterium 44XB]